MPGKSNNFDKVMTLFQALVWMCIIFLLSSRVLPSASSDYWEDFFVKKTAHITVYGILFLLWYRSFIAYQYKKIYAILGAFVITVLYAVSDEFHQSFVPGRSPALRDVGFDTIGASISALFLWNIKQILPPKLLKSAKKLHLLV